MKISYNWLKSYIDIPVDIPTLSQILTDIALEVEGIEEITSIKGGLKGLVVGEVLTKSKHPNADKLNCTTVNVGNGTPLSIVCGAPNVDAGQKVIVATVGTELYSGDEAFKIKKSKIRGEVSEGMICAEDEIGIGESHDGILVLPQDTPVGMSAAEYFNIETDYIIEIGLTPNRADAMSHIGVARDLKAYFEVNNQLGRYELPSISSFNPKKENSPISIQVENHQACKRYAGIYIKDVTIEDSPAWLQNRLKGIGLTPINNVVDITNFVLHEYGQPLHAFDADKIQGNKVIVKNLPSGTAFTTLDDVERKLDENDLMICDEQGGMCIAGVFGGKHSGVSNSTSNIFLESAYFDPVSVRKSSKRHQLKTDASFRFERGIDPNITVEALKRAALLIEEIAKGTLVGEIMDIYPTPIQDYNFDFNPIKSNELLGEIIPEDFVLKTLKALDIKVNQNDASNWNLTVPAYRVDVTRPADITEEILRIYGYNNIATPAKLNASLVNPSKPDNEKIKSSIFNYLADVGFNEAMNNSLGNPEDYLSIKEYNPEEAVSLLNPISKELAIMRPDMIGGGLANIAYNLNRKATQVRLFEFGRTYIQKGDHYKETQMLSLWVAGSRHLENWNLEKSNVSFFYLRGVVENLLTKMGFKSISFDTISNSRFADGLTIKVNNKGVGAIGMVNDSLNKRFDIDTTVFYAELNWDKLFQLCANNKIKYQPIPKFPAVRRDLSLLINKEISFSDLKSLAEKTTKGILKEVGLFDVYEGKNLPEGKKSYALYFILQDEEKTLNDKIIDKTMGKIQYQLENQLGASLR